jgi:hypothetical protein
MPTNGWIIIMRKWYMGKTFEDIFLHKTPLFCHGQDTYDYLYLVHTHKLKIDVKAIRKHMQEGIVLPKDNDKVKSTNNPFSSSSLVVSYSPCCSLEQPFWWILYHYAFSILNVFTYSWAYHGKYTHHIVNISHPPLGLFGIHEFCLGLKVYVENIYDAFHIFTTWDHYIWGHMAWFPSHKPPHIHTTWLITLRFRGLNWDITSLEYICNFLANIINFSSFLKYSYCVWFVFIEVLVPRGAFYNPVLGRCVISCQNSTWHWHVSLLNNNNNKLSKYKLYMSALTHFRVQKKGLSPREIWSLWALSTRVKMGLCWLYFEQSLKIFTLAIVTSEDYEKKNMLCNL